MDPFLASRAKFPFPSFFGLVDDMSNIILRDHLDLVSGTSPSPAAVVVLIKLRLINRETYFFLEHRCFPSLSALSSTREFSDVKNSSKKYSFVTLRPWYELRNVALQVVQEGTPLCIFQRPHYWDLWKTSTLDKFVQSAINVRNIFVLRAILANFGDRPEWEQKRTAWRKTFVAADYGEAYTQTLADSNVTIMDDTELELLVEKDAVSCFRAMLANRPRGPSKARTQLLLHANKILENPTKRHTAVLVRATVHELLENVRPGTSNRTTRARAVPLKRMRDESSEAVAEESDEEPPQKRARTALDVLEFSEE
jgi:hypothetical protein